MDTLTFHETNATYKILSDSGVFVDGDGYERVLLVAGWDLSDLTRICQIHLRVDKHPEKSFARGSVYGRTSKRGEPGWILIGQIAPINFWYAMPGYARAANESANTSTIRLSARVANLMESLHRSI